MTAEVDDVGPVPEKAPLQVAEPQGGHPFELEALRVLGVAEGLLDSVDFLVGFQLGHALRAGAEEEDADRAVGLRRPLRCRRGGRGRGWSGSAGCEDIPVSDVALVEKVAIAMDRDVVSCGRLR